MPAFNNWKKFHKVPAKSPNGGVLRHTDGSPMLETVEVPRWSTPETINFLKARGRSLAETACRDGWHISLIDFVQHQHRLPSSAECEEIVLDFQKIEAATQHSIKRQQIVETRNRIKAELIGEELQAAE